MWGLILYLLFYLSLVKATSAECTQWQNKESTILVVTELL